MSVFLRKIDQMSVFLRNSRCSACRRRDGGRYTSLIHTISVLLAKGRARVSVADAATDWPKRIRDMQYLDHESIVAGA